MVKLPAEWAAQDVDDNIFLEELVTNNDRLVMGLGVEAAVVVKDCTAGILVERALRATKAQQVSF